MKIIKTVAVCALVALGVGATSATAASLITSAQIKDGTIKIRDLSPALQAKIKLAGKPGPQAPRARTERAAASGQRQRRQRPPGANGHDGRDGVRYDRVTGSCDENGTTGEVAIAGGAARLGVPDSVVGADPSYPQTCKLSDLERLSFTSNASDAGVVYMKVTTRVTAPCCSARTRSAGRRAGSRHLAPRMTCRSGDRALRTTTQREAATSWQHDARHEAGKPSASRTCASPPVAPTPSARRRVVQRRRPDDQR